MNAGRRLLGTKEVVRSVIDAIRVDTFFSHRGVLYMSEVLRASYKFGKTVPVINVFVGAAIHTLATFQHLSQ